MERDLRHIYILLLSTTAEIRIHSDAGHMPMHAVMGSALMAATLLEVLGVELP